MQMNRRGLFKTLLGACVAPFVAKALPLNGKPLPSVTLDEINRITLEYLKANPIADTIFMCGGSPSILYWSKPQNPESWTYEYKLRNSKSSPVVHNRIPGIVNLID